MRKFLRRSQRLNRDLDALRRDIDTDVHIKSAEDLLRDLQVDPEQGLSTIVARDRLREQGPNTLTPPKKTLEILKILHHCCNGFSLLIWVVIYEKLHFERNSGAKKINLYFNKKKNQRVL